MEESPDDERTMIIGAPWEFLTRDQQQKLVVKLGEYVVDILQSAPSGSMRTQELAGIMEQRTGAEVHEVTKAISYLVNIPGTVRRDYLDEVTSLTDSSSSH